MARTAPAGRSAGRPTDSDVLRALHTLDGLDRVESVDLTPTGARSPDSIPADGQVYAEPSDVTVVVTSVEETS